MEPLTTSVRGEGIRQGGFRRDEFGADRSRRDAVRSEGVARRDVLASALGLGLSFALPSLDARAAARRGPERAKSLIVLWLAGGPSQLETWDPHPGTAVGGPTKDRATKNPDVRIAEPYERIAEEMDALSVIRSLTSKEGDHERGTYHVKTGYRPDPTLVHPSLGAILAHEIPNPKLEIPDHVSLVPGPWPGRGGYFGDRYDAFRVNEPGGNLLNLRAPVLPARQERRTAGLDVISKALAPGRRIPTERSLHQETIERALRMMRSDQLAAFDVAPETQAVRDAYGDTSFGRGCLVARRLVETGVRAVEVTLSGFDTHAGNFEAHAKQAAILDPAFARLVRDLRVRDLWDSTVVLCLGEFGRTPRINALDGRDHWPGAFSCVLGGGGLRGGLVIGATDPTGEKKEPSDPVPVADLAATVLDRFGLDPAKESITPVGRPMALSSGKPIARLVGT